MKAGASAQELASAINSNSNATVYAAALESGKLVLSNRATGNTGRRFIAVTDPGGTLTEQAGTRQGGQERRIHRRRRRGNLEPPTPSPTRSPA